jgi:hypothetical protein
MEPVASFISAPKFRLVTQTLHGATVLFTFLFSSLLEVQPDNTDCKDGPAPKTEGVYCRNIST